MGGIPAEPVGPLAASDDLEPFDLLCPHCGSDLLADESFETLRICSSCRRHFSMPARERVRLLVDDGSFAETNAALVSIEPLVFNDSPYPGGMGGSHDRNAMADAVVTGQATIGTYPALLIVLDLATVGGGLGIVAGEKVALAIEQAAERSLPLVVVCSGGEPHTQAGILSLVQVAKIAAVTARLHREGIPIISILTHPTTGTVLASLAGQSDIVFAEPGAGIGITPIGLLLAEDRAERGQVDGILDRSQQRETLANLLGVLQRRPVPRPEGGRLPDLGSPVPVWEALKSARNPARLTATQLLDRLSNPVVQLHGDRLAGDDPTVVCAFGRISGRSVAVVAIDRTTHLPGVPSGRVSAAGFRKVGRLLRLAGHLDLPVVTLIDGPGADLSAGADAEGVGLAISQVMGLLAVLPVPVVSVVWGEAGGLGGLALGIADRVLMMERAVATLPPPERALTRLFGAHTGLPASPHALPALDCQRVGLVDVIVPESVESPGQAVDSLAIALATNLADLAAHSPRRLLKDRARRLRTLGLSSPEGHEAARREVRELQDLQRVIARSLGDLRHDLRDRLDQRSLPTRPTRADLSVFATRLRERRPTR